MFASWYSHYSFVSLQILFDTQQWDNLTQEFKQEFYKLYGMTHEPLLNIHLQAGLSALKTPYFTSTISQLVLFMVFLKELLRLLGGIQEFVSCLAIC